MFNISRKVKSCSKWTSLRCISQFKVKNTCGCIDVVPRTLKDPKVCSVRDSGLILGVYYNDNVLTQPATLTASAQKYNEQTNGRLWSLLKMSSIPRLGESRVFFDVDPFFGYVAVVGLGSECLTYNSTELLDEGKEAIRIAAATGANALKSLQPKKIFVESFGHAESAAEGATLSIWKFQEYKKPSKQSREIHLNMFDDCDLKGWNLGYLKADSQNLARFLQEMPANYLNPTSFAKIAVELLCELGINVDVKTQGWAESHEMGGFSAVGKSSCQPPLFVEISYYGGDRCERPIVLIGKGVTFNSGSLSLKTPEVLRHMKADMAGAACVVAITRAAALLNLPVNIRGILPLCELMPNCNSPKFGDVFYSASGKTVSITNTCREGRLLVADSLLYARNYWPKLIVDIGTMSHDLTTALGPPACACYSNSEDLFTQLQIAGSNTGDRVWRMPLWNFYADRIKKTQNADLSNAGEEPGGDSPNCAAFLQQFVQDCKWVHLDTYNVTYTRGKEFPYIGRGMTGRPTRTIIELLLQLQENKTQS